ncbi:MAG: GTPase ObgE [Erysipelotrichia bacterium]|jgi:GTP-binding protein|nr:GTPase ObgE [Erysipelotrichia bacterium]
MFIDKVELQIKAGKGGDGLVAYRREKYVPLGGPYGGDGGDGGNVVFVVNTHKTTLLDLRYQKLIKSEAGENGKNKLMHGAKGKDTIIQVPLGTIIKDKTTGKLIADLVEEDAQAIIAKGGQGGRGNARFKTPRNPAPDFAEKGELGESKEVIVELKLLADVGLLGFPSVGKSTFLSVISAARPEIAPYPFTTITPKLGVVQVGDGRSFVCADMPGLIEGASLGKGLGHHFLKHIERTRVLIHIIDMGAEDGRDPIEDYEIINQEIKNYVVDLSDRPQIVVANKMDLDAAQENLRRFKSKYPNIEVFEMIAPIQEGLNPILYRAADILDVEKAKQPMLVIEEFVYDYVPEPDKYSVSKIGPNLFRLEGDALLAKFRQSNFETEEGARRFAYLLKRWGVDKALKAEGCVDGDIVAIENNTFVFIDE